MSRLAHLTVRILQATRMVTIINPFAVIHQQPYSLGEKRKNLFWEIVESKPVSNYKFTSLINCDKSILPCLINQTEDKELQFNRFQNDINTRENFNPKPHIAAIEERKPCWDFREDRN